MIDITSVSAHLDTIKGIEVDLKENTAKQYAVHQAAAGYRYSGHEERQIDQLQQEADLLKAHKANALAAIRTDVERQITEEAEIVAAKFKQQAQALAETYRELLALDMTIAPGMRAGFLHPAWCTTAKMMIPSDSNKLRALSGVGAPTNSGTGVKHLVDGAKVLPEARELANSIKQEVNDLLGEKILK